MTVKPKPNIRLKVLKAVGRQPHRYTWLRRLSQAATLGILAGVPLSGMVRVDLWRGGHRLLFEPAAAKPAVGAALLGIAAMYVVTFLSNLVGGRLFCGWGCPVGQVSRLGEAVDEPGLPSRRRLLRQAQGAMYSGVLILALMAWWIDLRVLAQGDPRWLAGVWAALLLAAAGACLHGRRWRWAFCRDACPIGMYYSVVSPAQSFGVHFRNQHDTCIDCGACDRVCPVLLHPRDLMEPVDDDRGLSVAGAPGRNHCLECGDCIRACELMIDLQGEGPVPLRLGFHTGPKRIDPAPACETAASP